MSHVLSAVAWPYANGPRHIGHVAGFGVPSDVFSRYMRMAGHDVLMVSGTDEHGTPILVAADAAGVTARDLADADPFLVRLDLDRGAVLVGAGDHQHLVARHPLVPAEHVARDSEAGDVADVPRAVSVGPGRRGQDVLGIGG